MNYSFGKHTDSREKNCLWRADSRLAQDVLAGNRSAVEEFLERMRCIPRILSSRNARLGHKFTADDLGEASQAVFSLVWKKLPEFRGEAALESWVFPFCSFTLMSMRRRQVREPSAIGATRLEPSIPVKERVYGEDMDDDLVLAALRALPPDERAVIELKQFEDLTFEAIAERLAIPENTAKSRYYRGLLTLRERLRAFDPKTSS